MLFNSYEFIFAFLPIVILGFYFIGYFRRGQAAFIWLVVCSYFFYGWWNYNYLPLLLATTVFNFFIGRHAGNLWQRDKPLARRFVALGIVLNLGALFYFKYTDLAVRTIDDVFRAGWHVPVIVLPLGISFFTFQKIAYLADVGKDGRSEAQFLNYALFVSFFPQLIAGPIVHPKDVLPQFERHPASRMDPRLLAMGLTIFAIGLFKKTVLADTIAPFANLVFDAAFHGQPIAVADAWGGALAYAMQIYFDFSGYSDMAIGLALLFGIRLPLNFNSPYQATNIIEFWRRWHMTLSRFLRDYLYIPLGGNRWGRARQYMNLMLTMVLGGIWHGANWTFAAWGLLHGTYLLINHLWQAIRPPARPQSLTSRWIGRVTTFCLVLIAWVFFRSADMPTALHLLQSMFFVDVEAGMAPTIFSLANNSPLLLTILVALAWVAPNTQTIMGYRPFAAPSSVVEVDAAKRWAPTIPWAIATILLLAFGVLAISGTNEFIYFQF